MLPSTFAFIISMAAITYIVFVIVLDVRQGSLNIKAKDAGDGQFGRARWMTDKEKEETYPVIPYTPKKWRKGKELPEDLDGATVVGYIKVGSSIKARIDPSDSHTLVLSAPGGKKTTGFLYPNMELTCASGNSFLATDTKGDVFRDYAGIAQRYYHYQSYVIDLRNPTRSDSFNLIRLVNKYMDSFMETGDLSDKARAERYAKITAKTIVQMDGFDGGGQNAFFYDAAEGLIAATTLLVSEFCKPLERHIVSVFKIILELLQTTAPLPTKSEKEQKIKPKNDFEKLIELLPEEHKARWFAGAALNSPESSMRSVMSTAISRLLSFIDSELEQILCFDSDIDAEQFCNGRTAVFIVFPEEDSTKHFLVSLFVSQLYNESLMIANQKGKNKLDKRVIFYLDEFGTMPKFKDAEGMLSAGRSRNILLHPMIQSLAQLNKNYGDEGGQIIMDCCANALFGSFAPLSKGAEEVSRALGTRTVLSGSVTNSGNGIGPSNSSKNLSLAQSQLMASEGIKTMPEDQWILAKTRTHPLLTVLKRFTEWGIRLDNPYSVSEHSARQVHYANKSRLKAAILERHPQAHTQDFDDIPPLPDGPPAIIRRHRISDDLL